MQYTCVKLTHPVTYIVILVPPEPIDGLPGIAETVDAIYYAMEADTVAGEELINTLPMNRDHGSISEDTFRRIRPRLRPPTTAILNNLRSGLSGHVIQLSFEEIIALIHRIFP